MTKTYLKNKVSRGIFLTLSTISIFFSNKAFAEQGSPCKVRWGFGCAGHPCSSPDENQYCVFEGTGDCDSYVGCKNGKVECMEGEYCVRKAWEVGYNLGNKRLGNRWVCPLGMCRMC